VLYQRAPDALDGSPDYFIADPYRYVPYATGDRSGKTLYQAYNKTLKQMSSSFQVEVVEDKAPQPGKAWAISGPTNVEFLIVSPSVKQTGYVSAKESYISDIPDASYGIEGGIADATGQGSPTSTLTYFGMNDPANGVYDLQIIAKQSGSYHLEISFAWGPESTKRTSFDGTLNSGQVDKYKVTIPDGIVRKVHN
jgi:hypothetical protein